jgi:hypothetical protein
VGKATNPNNGHKIAYLYDASGTKLRQAVIATNGTVTKTTDYIGGMPYEGNILLMKQTAFGRKPHNFKR